MSGPSAGGVRFNPFGLAAAALLLAALFAGAAWFDREQRAQTTAIRSAELASIAELKTDWIVQWRDRLLGDVRHARDPLLTRAIAEFLRHPGDEVARVELQKWLEQLRADHDHRAAVLVTLDGKPLLFAGERIDALDAPSRELLAAAVAARAPRIGSLHRSTAAAGEARLDVAAPIVDPDGAPRAALLLRVAPETELFALVRRWPTPSRSAETMLVRRDGDNVVFLNPLRHVAAPALSVHRAADLPDLVAAQAVRGVTGIVRGTDYRGVEVLADLRPVPGTNWLMVTKVDAAELLADARQRSVAIVAAVAVLTVTLLLALAMLSAMRHRNAYRRLFVLERDRSGMLEEYRATLQGIGDGVLSTDTEGRVRRMNEVSERLTGWTEAEATGRPLPEVFAIVNENTRATVDNPAFRAMREGRIVGLANHTLLVARDGSERPIADSAAPVRDADGHVVGAVLVFRDQSAERARERALRETAAYYQLLFMSNPIPGWVFDVETLQFLAVNDAAVRQYGWSHEEFARMTAIDVRPPEEAARFRQSLDGNFDELVRQGRNVFVHRRRDGSLITARIYAFEVRHQGRRARMVLAVDITDRVRAEHDLVESTRFLRAVLDSVGTHVAILDDAGKIVMVNEAWRRFARDNDGDLALLCEGGDYLEACERAQGDDVWQAHAAAAAIRRVIAGESAAPGIEYRCDSPTQRRWFVLSVRRFAGAGPVRVVVTHVDISSHRLAEEEYTKLAMAIEQGPASVVITNTKAEIEYVNAALEHLTGYRRSELIGRNPRVFASGKTPAWTYRSLWDALRAGRMWSGEFFNRAKDGREFVERATMIPIRDANQQVTHYVAVKEDVTERHRIERELEHYRLNLEREVAARTAELTLARQQAEAASQAKSVFLASMSHEIRTPMNGVLGLVEVLGHSGLNEQQRELLKTIQDSGAALLALIDEILDFSKIEAERLELRSAPFDLASTVEGVADALAPLAARGGSEISVFVSPRIPVQLVGDGLRLRQVLLNLVGNALKFSGAAAGRPGRISISVDVAGRDPWRLAFAVEDNGIGIDPALMPQLFEPFVQGSSPGGRARGTGLGLTICKRLGELMGGRLDVESTPGIGSTFTVTLPFDEARGPQPPALPDLGGLAAVVLSDGACESRFLVRYLEHAGVRVARAASLAEAEQLANHSDAAPLLVVCASGQPGLERADVDSGRWLGQLWITPGQRRRPRLDAPGIVSLDLQRMRRAALLNAAAIAAGRLPPEEIAAPLEEPRATPGAAARRAFQTASPPSAAPEASAASAAFPASASTASEASATPAGSAAQPASATPVPAARERILVAEDDEINCRVVVEQLRLLGYDSRIARDGNEALRLWREGGDALLLTDLNMPGMDGYMLALTIRGEEARGGNGDEAPVRLPIVALTANALAGEAERARKYGIDDYLTKPVQLDRLRETLQHWIRPVVDVAVLEALVGDAPEAIAGLLREYHEAARDKGGQLLAACRGNDTATAASLAHQLKSSSRATGARALATLCSEIERQALAREPLGGFVAALDTELARASAAILEILEGSEGGTDGP